MVLGLQSNDQFSDWIMHHHGCLLFLINQPTYPVLFQIRLGLPRPTSVICTLLAMSHSKSSSRDDLQFQPTLIHHRFFAVNQYRYGAAAATNNSGGAADRLQRGGGCLWSVMDSQTQQLSVKFNINNSNVSSQFFKLTVQRTPQTTRKVQTR